MRAFEAAGWSRAEPLSLKSRTKMLAALAHPHRYTRAPVSTLFLEGRPPDLVFEKEDDTLAKRDHVRFWLRPSADGDQAMWLGAATHGVGISFRHQRFGFTHVVHAQLDEERSRIVFDLMATGWVDKVSVYDRADAIRHSRNATGDHLETDGRLTLIELRPQAPIGGSVPSTKPKVCRIFHAPAVGATQCLICGTRCRKMDTDAAA